MKPANARCTKSRKQKKSETADTIQPARYVRQPMDQQLGKLWPGDTPRPERLLVLFVQRFHLGDTDQLDAIIRDLKDFKAQVVKFDHVAHRWHLARI